MADDKKLGFSGSLAKRFQDSKITPLLALTGLLLGFFAVAVTPREEEPQINVTFREYLRAVPRRERRRGRKSCRYATGAGAVRD